MPVLREVLVDELRDLLHAEGQLVKVLPTMARAAHADALKSAFERHTEETKGHAERLRQVFELLNEKAKPKPCKAMQGLIEEGQEKISEGKQKEESAADLMLVASAQKVEHYEIASYGTVRTMAEQLGETKIARLLAQTLSEEEKTDKLLTRLSPPLLKEAAQAVEEEQEVG